MAPATKGAEERREPLGARILAVTNMVETISFRRPHRPALGIDKALAEIDKGKGTLYDEQMVDVCLSLFREEGFEFE